MRILLTILGMLYSAVATPEQTNYEWWQVFGEPCTTATDRAEHTCNLKVKWKPTWHTTTTR